MEHQLDVSELEPCEPLERTIEAIKRLKRGDVLRIVHRREPHLLYPLLEKGGFSWSTRTGGTSRFEILIWHRGDQQAESAVQSC
ncbi:MAG: DUF2249 domain-containing protein [Gammaproteobacteria bacterium]|nr:DUF2249 domain-containing protein [Gammaproteobacteria bacterium]MCP5416947.1 DUF2249 domain-containing protein [Chromatiaceae bacterium]